MTTEQSHGSYNSLPMSAAASALVISASLFAAFPEKVSTAVEGIAWTAVELINPNETDLGNLGGQTAEWLGVSSDSNG